MNSRERCYYPERAEISSKGPLKYGLSDPSCVLKKLVSLLSDEVASQMIDRHCQLLNNYIAIAGESIMLKDVSLVTAVLTFLSEHVEQIPKYKRLLKELLQLCSSPPLLEKSSDCLNYAIDLQDYFSILGYLICCAKHEKQQLLLVRVLLSVLSRPQGSELPYVGLPFCNKAAEESDLPKTLGELLEFTTWPVYLSLLDLAVMLASISTKTCLAMVYAGVIDAIFLRMDINYLSRDISSPSGLLEDVSKRELLQNESENIYTSLNALLAILHSLNESDKPVSVLETYRLSKRSLWSMRYILRRVIPGKYVELRNDLLCMLLLTLTVFPNTAIIESGLADDLAMLSVAPELCICGNWAENLTLTSSQEDFLFKKLLFLINCHIRNYPDVSQVFKRQKVVRGILKFIDQHLESTIWSPFQLWELIRYALNCLSLIFPVAINDFTEENGAQRLLKLTMLYLKTEFDIHILLCCWRTIALALTKGTEELHSELQDEASFSCIFRLCNHILTKSCITLKMQSVLTYTFHSLEVLTRNQPSVQTMCGDDAIALVQGLFYRILLSKPEDPPFSKWLIISAVDFLWECIVWNPQNIITFIQQGGTYMLLDLIQRDAFPVKLIALGVLVDMVDEGSCITHVLTWRTGAANCMQMLLDVWREEEMRLKCTRTKQGVIMELKYPLMGEQQKKLLKCTNTSISPAMSDVVGSARPKIYAVIHMITQRYKDKMNFILDKYHMRHLELTAEAQVTMLLAKNYLALKMAEVWGEIIEELQQMGVHPIKIDQDALELLKQHYDHWARSIQEEQNQFLAQHEEEETKKEHEFYTQIWESELSDTLDILQEMDSIARTSDKQFQVAHKKRQRELTDQCFYLLDASFKSNVHRTFIEDTAVEVQGGLIMQMHGDYDKYTSQQDTVPCVSTEDINEGPGCFTALSVLHSYSEFPDD